MVKIYADGASLEQMERFASDVRIEGFTTNPSLMRKSGIVDYRAYARAVLDIIGGKPVSFEVIADDFETIRRQASEIASWGENVWVKIPITNTKGESSIPLVKELKDIKINLTAVFTDAQIEAALKFLKQDDILSVFVGRITDTQNAPPYFWQPFKDRPCKVLWASAREAYSVTLAHRYGYDIITLTPELIAKLPLEGKDLAAYSLETVKQFHEDGRTLTL